MGYTSEHYGFERWRHTFNHERPHESLAQQRPCEFYQPVHAG
jgi:transposase InsO family protein